MNEKVAEIINGSVHKIMDLRISLASQGCLTPEVDGYLLKAAAELAPLVRKDPLEGIRYVLSLKEEYEPKLKDAAIAARKLTDSVIGIDEIEDFLKNGGK